MFKDAIISAFFGALGPFFNKQATTDPNRLIVKKLNEFNLLWAIYIYNVVCIGLMLTMNTISVKHKMLSYKNDGAFLGTTLIFSLGYLFSAFFDLIIGESHMPLHKYLAVLMVIFGVMLITFNSEESGRKMKTQSVIDVLDISISKKKLELAAQKAAELAAQDEKNKFNLETENCQTAKSSSNNNPEVQVSAITPQIKPESAEEKKFFPKEV